MRFLGLDIGTTRMKCGVYDESGALLYADGCDYGVRQWGKESYLDAEAVWECAKALLGKAYGNFAFDSVTISSLGESFALLGKGDELLFPPMLYTDSRGEEEANAFKEYAEKIFRISGVCPQGMYAVYKLLWIKAHRPDVYRIAEKLMLVGDFVGYQLTGKLLESAKPDVMVLHCLPAHRGEEISSAVFEQHAPEIFDEAENRLHVQKAVLAILLAGK